MKALLNTSLSFPPHMWFVSKLSGESGSKTLTLSHVPRACIKISLEIYLAILQSMGQLSSRSRLPEDLHMVTHRNTSINGQTCAVGTRARQEYNVIWHSIHRGNSLKWCHSLNHLLHFGHALQSSMIHGCVNPRGANGVHADMRRDAIHRYGF